MDTRSSPRRGPQGPALSLNEWAIVAPMIPPGRHGGRKRSVNVREVLNGISYVRWTGCRWKALPKDLPPKSGLGATGRGDLLRRLGGRGR